MVSIRNKAKTALHKAPQPPLSYRGATCQFVGCADFACSSSAPSMVICAFSAIEEPGDSMIFSTLPRTVRFGLSGFLYSSVFPSERKTLTFRLSSLHKKTHGYEKYRDDNHSLNQSSNHNGIPCMWPHCCTIRSASQQAKPFWDIWIFQIAGNFNVSNGIAVFSSFIMTRHPGSRRYMTKTWH